MLLVALLLCCIAPVARGQEAPREADRWSTPEAAGAARAPGRALLTRGGELGGLAAGLTSETPVHLSAERLVRDERGIVRAEGNVRLSAGAIVIGAERVEYDPEAETARLEGPVTLVDGPFVARASSAFMDLSTKTGVLQDVALFQKEEPLDPEAVLGQMDTEAVRALGKNELELHAEQVSLVENGEYVALGPSVTTCDCDDRSPDWRIGASSATLGTDDRLRLRWPVVYAKGVPILASPYLSLPLTNERKSGFLFAVPHLAGRRGPSYEQPLYLVLGHSYDMTISAGYYFGHATPVSTEDGAVVTETPSGEVLKEDAFRGPRGSVEFRYTPRLGTAGRAFVAYGYDLSKRGDDVLGGEPHRYGIQLDHRDEWEGGFADRLAINLVSDRNYVRDFVDDIVLRGEQTLRSTAWFAWRSESALAVAEGVYQQDLRPAFESGVTPPPTFHERLGLFGGGTRDTFQRVPAVAFDLARLPLPMGTGLSLHLGAARFAPWTRAAFGDWGLDGLGPGDAGYPGPDEGEGDGLFERGRPGSPGEQPAVNRLSIRPTLSAPILFGRYLSLTPSVGWREELYDYEQGRGSGAVGWGVVGASAHTEVARSFANGVRHAWIPRLEARTFLPAHETNAPVGIYDELDERPTRATTQGRVSLGSELLFPERLSGRALSLDVTVGQDAILVPEAQLAETFGSASLELWPFALTGLIQWDPHRELVTETVAQGSWSDRRGDQLRASYRSLANGGSSRLRAAPDELFADRYFTEESRPIIYRSLEQIGVGATVVPLRGLSLSYDLLFLPDLSRAKLLQQQASIGYSSACDCWAGALHFAKRRDEGLDFWVSFNLGQI